MRTGLVLAMLATVLLARDASAEECFRAVNLSNEADKDRTVDLDGAISKYEQASALDPSNPRILWKLATAYVKKEDWEKVVVACGQAEKLAPTHATYFYLHGYAIARLAEKGTRGWSDALEPLQTAARLDPNYSDPHFDLGNVHLHMDDEQGAMAEWTAAIRLKPSEMDYYVPLADLYIRLRLLAQAEVVLKEAVNFAAPGSSPTGILNVHTLYGELHERRGNRTGAVSEFEAAHAACGSCSSLGQQMVFFNLGAAYLRLTPPNRSGAASNLTTFVKTLCHGGAAARYADECMQAQELLKRVGSP